MRLSAPVSRTSGPALTALRARRSRIQAPISPLTSTDNHNPYLPIHTSPLLPYASSAPVSRTSGPAQTALRARRSRIQAPISPLTSTDFPTYKHRYPQSLPPNPYIPTAPVCVLSSCKSDLRAGSESTAGSEIPHTSTDFLTYKYR